MAGGWLCEGQDLWAEKAEVRMQRRKQGALRLEKLCQSTYSCEEELLSQNSCTGIAEVRCESQQPATELHQELL